MELEDDVSPETNITATRPEPAAVIPLRPEKASIVFLGTSSGAPTLDRNVSATLLELPGLTCLIDCGEGTQHQFLKGKVSFVVDKIYITHLHGDHCLGLPGLLAMRTMKKAENALEVIGPRGIKQLVETAIGLTQTFLKYSLSFTELEENKPHELGSVCGWRVSAHPLKHRVPCFGYVFHEEPAPGRYLSERAVAQGVPKGPLLGQLAKTESVTLSDGRVVLRRDCLGPPQPGRKIVILGDTCDSEGIRQAAQDCDVLVHEATFHASMADRALVSGHSTGQMAAAFAKSINAGRLVLTHFSQRYTTPGAEITVAAILAEAQAAFGRPAEVIAASDFTEVVVPPKNRGR